MGMPVGMRYAADETAYFLSPDYVVNLRSLRVMGAAIISLDGVYLGYWDRYNMPMQVVYDLERWAKTNCAREISDKRTALEKQRRENPFKV